jgi:hypothetical protein
VNQLTDDLHEKINEGRDACTIIEARREERAAADGYRAPDDSVLFSVFTRRLSLYQYPEFFKPIGITKYDSKQAPQQWLSCSSTAIEVTGGSNTTKVIYFLALETAPLTWLESLTKYSIDS